MRRTVDSTETLAHDDASNDNVVSARLRGKVDAVSDNDDKRADHSTSSARAPDENASASAQAWTATATANHLIAQVEDALHGGWDRAALSQALQHQGLEAETAETLLRDVEGMKSPEGGTNDAPEVIELLSLRRFMRSPDSPLVLLDSRRDDLVAALEKIGLPGATAAAVTSELASLERRGAAVYFGRMRRLGVQGMVVGGLATLFLGYGGLYGGPQARWHLVTAAVTLGLFLYSIVLFRRGRA